jgi:chromosome segregation ATPase
MILQNSDGNELESSIKAIAEYVKKQVGEVKKNSLTREELREEISKLRRDVLPQIDKLEMQINDLKSYGSEKDDMEKRLIHLETGVADLQNMKSKHSELDKKLTALHTTIGEKAFGGVEDKSLVDAHVKRLNELEKKIENINKIVARSGQGIVLSNLKNEIDNKFDNMAAELESKMKFIDKMIGEVPERPAFTETVTTNERLEKELEFLQLQIDEVKKAAPDDDFEKNEDIEDVRQALDEEMALRSSLDKKITEMGLELKDVSSSMGKLKQLANLDYKKILAAYEKDKNIDNVLENKMKEEMLKIVAKELDNFAIAMDKKLPHLATKDDLAKLENALRKMPKMATTMSNGAGDPVALDAKISTLEKRMNELITTMRGHRNSFVLE